MKKFIPPSKYTTRTYHCRTYKFSTLFEQQFFIIKSKLSFNLGLGAEIYFFNQMKESYYFDIDNNCVRSSQPSVLLNYHENKPFGGSGLYLFGYITRVPFALTGNVALQYQFKNMGLKIYFEPNFIRIKYKRADKLEPGDSFLFYSNLGLSFTYPLQFNKKLPDNNI